MKKFTSILLAISIILTTIIVLPLSASATTDIKLGDYLQMGQYYGQPVLWRCVAFEKVTGYDKNNNPITDSTQTSTTYQEGYLPLMMADRIICLKPFDARGISAKGSHGRGYCDYGKQGYYRREWGSNYWGDSNIRNWLNSNASAGDVVWTCGNPPDNSHVYDGYNDYANEAGFLTNFNKAEQKAIQTVTQKSLLDGYEHSGSDNKINSDCHKRDSSISDIVQNYANAYSEQVTDKMFLPDVKQINTVYNNSDTLGNNYYIGIPTEEAVKNSEYKNSSLTATDRWWSWLRSPYASYYSYNVRNVYSDGIVYGSPAYNGDGGVRPAFYLNLTSVNLLGTGTKADPYKVCETKVFLNGEQLYFDVEPIFIADHVMVPMRNIFEALGATVSYNEKTKTVEAYSEKTFVSLTIGNPVIMIDGKETIMDVAPVEIDGRTLVPLRAVSESLGVKVDWSEELQTVYLSSK